MVSSLGLGGCQMGEPIDVGRLHGAKDVSPLFGTPSMRMEGYHVPWLELVLPSDHQRSDTTCVVRSIAGNAEAVARKNKLRIPFGHQIGVKVTYADVMRADYNGRDVGGMTLPNGLRGCLRSGILPPGTTVRNVKTRADVLEALNVGPLLMTLWTTRGWLNPWPNGYINVLADRTPMSGHCVLMLGILTDHGADYVLFQEWQGSRTGWNGCRIISWPAWEATRHSTGAALLVRPAGTETWEGWRPHLVNAMEGD